LASLDRLSQDQPRSARAATTVDYITGTAVLEFGPAETLSPIGAMSPAYTCLRRPRHLPRPAHPRGKPAFSTAARYLPRETDCLLEGESRANPSLKPNSLLAGKLQGILRNYVADTPTQTQSAFLPPSEAASIRGVCRNDVEMLLSGQGVQQYWICHVHSAGGEV
jgi:hypothetical protein